MNSEISRRRTFAIISHPDAGKTTITEKLLLYGGAIHLAGSVKGKNSRQTTSDWMEIEKQRGISVSTSVLQFEYAGKHINLLDTPGHNDFSEDTYRTLAAVDSVVMLIDCVKGVEPQTIKLFKVCRMRGIPIATFINKMDRLGREPLELLDEIERVLGIPCSPINWPVGAGHDFCGVFARESRELLRFETVAGGSERANTSVGDIADPELRTKLGERSFGALNEELALLDGVFPPFDHDKFVAGQLTPVFFGSAMTNFGIEPFLDAFVDMAPPPQPRKTVDGSIAPTTDRFSAFIFKIQANMDRKHRDRIAFARVCSGRFARGMDVLHVRSGKHIELGRSMNFVGHERQQVDEAYAGDVVGLWDPGILRIGDTLCDGAPIEFDGVPRFSPEHFVRVRLVDTTKRKQLKKGLDQLSEEGAVQMFFDRQRLERDPILGAVGVLQFEVVQQRMESEYGTAVAFDRLPYQHARWLEGDFDFAAFKVRPSCLCVVDVEGRPLALFDTEWSMRNAETENPKVKFIAAVQPGRSVRSA